VKSHRSPKTGRWRKLFTLLDFRPENQLLVITISTISMRRNCSISCLAAPGGAQDFSAHLDPPRDNYDVQSNAQRLCSQQPCWHYGTPPEDCAASCPALLTDLLPPAQDCDLYCGILRPYLNIPPVYGPRIGWSNLACCIA
jgi:hypothetical protein